jgi:hypothetical protein
MVSFVTEGPRACKNSATGCKSAIRSTRNRNVWIGGIRTSLTNHCKISLIEKASLNTRVCRREGEEL